MALFIPILKKIAGRQDDQEEDLQRIKAQTKEEFERQAALIADLQGRLGKVEGAVEEFDAQIRHELARLRRESRTLRTQTRNKLKALEQEHSALIKCLEMSIAKQVQPERHQRINSLLKTARQRHTRIHNEIERRSVQ